MAEFKDRLLERIREKYAVRDAPGQNGYGVEFKNAALFGAKAALEMAADFVSERETDNRNNYLDMRMPQDLGAADEARYIADELRTLARELEADRG